MSASEPIGHGMNPAQREATLYLDGPCLVLAGAGSGKTRVITQKIAYLLRECGYMGRNVVALTFTNKAAREMDERVKTLVDRKLGKGLTISTFHSLGVKLLREEARNAGLKPTFSILDADDAMAIIQELLNTTDKARLRHVQGIISLWKNALMEPDDAAREAITPGDVEAANVYRSYAATLAAYQAVDFDDLIRIPALLLANNEEVRTRWQNRVRYLLVDEYQDTNHVQYTLVRQLAGGHRNICVVGDDDQSIYGWRGADIRNILEFEKDYPGVQVIKLEQNYRSTQCILAVANALITYNKGRKSKALWTSNGVGDPVSCYRAFDEKDEAKFVVATIRDLVTRDEAAYRDCAVFYRTHAQSRSIEEECIRSGLPYRIYGGLRFYERKEIKDILAYLRLVANPADEVSLRRVVNVPRRGIGDTTIGRAEETALREGRSFVDVLSHPDGIPELGARAVRTLQNFFKMLDGWRKLDGEISVADLMERILDETGYRSALETEKNAEAETRIENLKEFLGVAQQYDFGGADRSLDDFLEELALVAEIDNYQPGEDAVVLMTIHSAKGMEFPVVFMTGLEEGLFPHVHALGEETELEEERRLCYVGITRAQKMLYLSWAIRRFIYGNSEYKEPSRFLQEIPQEYLCPVVPGGSAGAVDQQGDAGSESQAKEGALAESAAGTKEAAAVSTVGQYAFQVGDKVEHKKFGRGVVMETKTGPGGDLEVYVSFETAGFKHLMAKYAPLKKV